MSLNQTRSSITLKPFHQSPSLKALYVRYWFKIRRKPSNSQIINLVLNGAAINALKAAFRAAIDEDRPASALIRRGFTNIPKCIVSRLMQRCTSSDTLHSGVHLLFSVLLPLAAGSAASFSPVRASPYLCHSLSTHLYPSPVSPFNSNVCPCTRARALSRSPLLMITSDFILDAEIVVVCPRFPKEW